MLDVLSHMHILLDPTILLTLTLGSLASVFIGCIPGISPTMAVALMVPVTFHMDPAGGLIMLGVVYTGGVAGGGIPAVLVNIPGAPANIATMFDGSPMARNGRAWEALCITFVYSGIGGLLGVLALIWLTPLLADFAMKFGPAELFWVTVFGITVIAGLSDGKILKGLYAGLFGMLISCIGFSPMLGEPRYVFHDALTGGVVIVPALIGMFAVPQLLELAETLHLSSGENLRQQLEEIKALMVQPKGVLREIVLNIRKWWKIVLTSSFIGTVVGIIPGAGGNVGGLISYDYAKKMSRTPEEYGKGNPEGVVASETANNATVGPALIPLLTLGVPGSPTAAALLGGLLIHGLFPGPDLFTKHLDVTLTFFAGLLAAQFLMVAAGLICARYAQHIMKVPALIMIGAISVLSVVGAYCVQNSVDDVYVMLGIGLLTYGAMKLGFPIAPCVLGIVLGPIAETNFLRGKLIAETDVGIFNYFFTGEINIVLIVISAASVIWGIWVEYRNYKRIKNRKGATA